MQYPLWSVIKLSWSAITLLQTVLNRSVFDYKSYNYDGPEGSQSSLNFHRPVLLIYSPVLIFTVQSSFSSQSSPSFSSV